MTDKSAQRVGRFDKKLAADGGRKLNGIRLQPDAAAVLAELEASGDSATVIINRLLREAGQAKP